ncbi:hypothetical protein OSB04_un000239 [Centaurea solstitialis]|uniref:F-box domain-containing protein n=1 Tax=Centaurea solstitialis TaxID=347529 RepID=A0AA38SI44_9ASTR|nr:hypothetical protein OSB04_un000239 [Centaurea solstitialis]
MEDLLEELTMDILSRLPVKTIFHCKLVCKKWRNLVSDSSFVNLHLSRSPTGLIIHHTDQGTFKWVEIVDNVDHHHLHEDYPRSHSLYMSPVYQHYLMYQTGSVNGLICVCPYSRKTNHDDAYICNPVTREFVILPRQRFWIEGLLEVIYGFGVSSLTGEYKVVRAYQAKGVQNGHKPARPSVLEAEVYTLGTGHWRSLCHVPVTYRLNTFQGFDFDVPFLNNRCHWIVSDYEDAHDKICTFDLDKETFQLLPSPPPPVKENRFHGQSLAILKGCLCKLDTYDSEVAIWVMKEYGINNSWHKQVVISRTIQWPFYEPMHLITALPVELTMEILSRLPVKTIIHCKLVCKKWRSLLLDSSFVNLHLSRSPTPTDFNIIIHNDDYAHYKNPGKLQLMETEDKVDHHHLHYHRLFILDLNLPFFRDSFVGVVFGFGVSSPTGEYKLVRASHRKTLPNANKPSQPSLLLEVEVYTLGTGQWRSRGPVPVPYWLHPFRNFNGTFLNNHCHWIVCDVENTNRKIVAFDLDKETFQLFPSPPSAKEPSSKFGNPKGLSM